MNKKSVLMISSYLLLYIAFPALLYIYKLNSPTILMLTLIANILLMILASLLYKETLQKDWLLLKEQEGSWGTLFKDITIVFILSKFLSVLGVLLVSNFINIEDLAQNQQMLNDFFQNNPFLFSAFLMVIFAPFIEELVFREAIIGPVHQNKRNKLILNTVISIVLFTAAHSLMLADAIIYLPITLSLTYIYWKYDRNIIASMAFHFINNGLAILMMYIQFKLL